MTEWKSVCRWFDRWFGHGDERLEAEILFRRMVGLKHYWASWKNCSIGPPTHISSFILWSIKSDKYLKPRELAILLNLFTDVLGYDDAYEVDEHEPYRQQKEPVRTFRRTGRREQDYLEVYDLSSLVFVNPMRNSIHGSSDSQEPTRTDDETGGSRLLTRAEIRRRRTRALGNR